MDQKNFQLWGLPSLRTQAKESPQEEGLGPHQETPALWLGSYALRRGGGLRLLGQGGVRSASQDQRSNGKVLRPFGQGAQLSGGTRASIRQDRVFCKPFPRPWSPIPGNMDLLWLPHQLMSDLDQVLCRLQFSVFHLEN